MSLQFPFTISFLNPVTDCSLFDCVLPKIDTILFSLKCFFSFFKACVANSFTVVTPALLCFLYFLLFKIPCIVVANTVFSS